MAETRIFTCIICPRGCSLEVEVEGGGPSGTADAAGAASATVLSVRGNACKRGEDYARVEVLDPRRRLTSTVRTAGVARRRLPVRSSAEIPLARLVEAARALDGVVARAPIRCGEVVVADLLGLGVDIVATDDL